MKNIERGTRMSQAVVHNDVVYLAGQVGSPGASVTQQTKDILEKIEGLLVSAGSGRRHLLSATIWLADMGDFGEMNAVWDAWVSKVNAPARATGEVRLAAPDYKVEIIITAAVAHAVEPGMV